MSRFRVYFQPFNELGNYTGTFEEVTDDVIDLGDISRSLDSTEYDVGIFKNDNVRIKLRNNEGRFSGIEDARSIFEFRRSNTQVKITWDIRSNPFICGVPTVEEIGYAGGEVTVFEGIIADLPEKSNANAQEVEFTVLGFEGLFKEVSTGAFDIDTLSNISTAIRAALTTTETDNPITDLLTVDASNITVDNDNLIDDDQPFQFQTALNIIGGSTGLLFAGNAVLYIDNRVVVVKPRTPSADLKYTFYGQGSQNGTENIVEIRDFRNGLNRTFNRAVWDDRRSDDSSSQSLYGIREKSVSATGITDTVKQDAILDTFVAEFATPKKEMLLTAPLNYDTLALTLLDRVAVDYPPVVFPVEGDDYPVYGSAEYGFVFPNEDETLVIDEDERFKILGFKILTKSDLIEFKLREI